MDTKGLISYWEDKRAREADHSRRRMITLTIKKLKELSEKEKKYAEN